MTAGAASGRLVALAVVLLRCNASERDPGGETTCAEVEGRLGRRACVHAVHDAATWTGISIPAAAVDRIRSTAYLVPARPDARLPPLFVDATAFNVAGPSLHLQFLRASFDAFQLLDAAAYLELVLDPERREWYAGDVTELVTEGARPLFGFTIADRGVSLADSVRCEDLEAVFSELAPRLSIGDVTFLPSTELQRGVASICSVPFRDPESAVAYEAYTRARGCGTLRRHTLASLASAQASGAIGFQDLLLVAEAPLDIDTIVGGIVTGTRQGELSHLNVRSASRGTPNCYLRGAFDSLAEWEGQLVELECGQSDVRVQPVDLAGAQACWEAVRPQPVAIEPPDLVTSELTPLLELRTETPGQRRAALARVGAKAANLATLYQRIDPELQLAGFAIPFRHYRDFLDGAAWTLDLGDGPEMLSVALGIQRLLSNAAFVGDGAVRRARLGELRDAIRAAPCDPLVLETIGNQIRATFGAQDVMVRFRSSSNAEDELRFNGAGLYDSTSVCLADDLDEDALGPSHCDPDQPDERGACRGLTKVWASLWNMKAVEERSWYGIDHGQVAMGVLVNARTKGELANVVAFTGNPGYSGDARYLVNAQAGELDVVAAVAGTWPEKDLISVSAGVVTNVERTRGSTELPAGVWVLSDERLGQLGVFLTTIAEAFPVDASPPAGGRILLDTEWKLRADGRFAVKQVRPFLD